MLGKDLRCPKCGGEAIDVAPALDLDRFLDQADEVWLGASCANGHAFCLHARATEDGLERRYLPQVFEG